MKIDSKYMDKFILFLLMIVLLILDNSFMPFLLIKGSYPSLLFIFAIAYSILKGRNQAIFMGIISGLLQDIFFYNGIGVNTVTNMLLCLIAAIIGENIYKEKRMIPVLTVMILTVIKVVIVWVIFKINGLNIDLYTGLTSAIYNSVVMVLVYKFIFKFYNNEQNKHSWRF